MFSILYWLAMVAIATFNAVGCGVTWRQTRRLGGWHHLLNWSGAIMSACGFMWSYLFVVIVGASFFTTTDPATGVTTPILTPDALKATIELGYLVIIFPVLGSGLVILHNSWSDFSDNPTLGGGLVAGWNMYAMVSNLVNALQFVPEAIGNVFGFFAEAFSGSDSKSLPALLVITVVVVSLGAGVLTTALIISVTAGAMERSYARSIA